MKVNWVMVASLLYIALSLAATIQKEGFIWGINMVLIIILVAVLCILVVLLWMIHNYQLAKLKHLERKQQEYLDALQTCWDYANNPKKQLLIENIHKHTCSKIKPIDQVKR